MYTVYNMDHKVSLHIKVHQNTNDSVRYLSIYMKMTNSPVINEVVIKQYLLSVVNINGKALRLQLYLLYLSVVILAACPF